MAPHRNPQPFPRPLCQGDTVGDARGRPWLSCILGGSKQCFCKGRRGRRNALIAQPVLPGEMLYKSRSFRTGEAVLVQVGWGCVCVCDYVCGCVHVYICDCEYVCDCVHVCSICVRLCMGLSSGVCGRMDQHSETETTSCFSLLLGPFTPQLHRGDERAEGYPALPGTPQRGLVPRQVGCCLLTGRPSPPAAGGMLPSQ